MKEEKKFKTIVLSLRIDYRTDGRNPQHAETAARMAVRSFYPTVEEGVRIERVAVAENGVELFAYYTDNHTETPRQSEQRFTDPRRKSAKNNSIS